MRRTSKASPNSTALQSRASPAQRENARHSRTFVQGSFPSAITHHAPRIRPLAPLMLLSDSVSRSDSENQIPLRNNCRHECNAECSGPSHHLLTCLFNLDGSACSGRHGHPANGFRFAASGLQPIVVSVHRAHGCSRHPRTRFTVVGLDASALTG